MSDAVNSHDALVEALKLSRAHFADAIEYSEDNIMRDIARKMLPVIDAALAPTAVRVCPTCQRPMDGAA
jgi:hypothetical protein